MDFKFNGIISFMNYTLLFGKILFKIDDYLGTWVGQGLLLVALTYVALYTDTWFANWWLPAGLISYFLMHGWNRYKNPQYHEELIESAKGKDGYRGMVKGFTYSLLLGPISIGLKIFLSRLDKIDRDNIKSKTNS